MRKTPVMFALAVGLAAGSVFAQTRELKFDVATIRPVAALNPQDVASGKLTLGMTMNGNRVTLHYVSISDMAATAWEVKPIDVKGPAGIGDQRFEITALLPEGATAKDMPQLVRSLLLDRFKMVAHKESKETQVYALTESRGGHKMKPSPVLAPPPAAVAEQAEPDPSKATGPGMTVNGQRMDVKQTASGPNGTNVSISGGANGAQKVSVAPDGTMHMDIERLTMAELAEQLTMLLDLPVQDHSGLSGSFQVGLDMSRADLMGMMNKMGMLPPEAQAQLSKLANADPGGAILASVASMGLRLEKQKASVPTLTIESTEKMPTEN
ncbi:MAG: TIGR03435 family protein [Acidobacteriota bacterium]